MKVCWVGLGLGDLLPQGPGRPSRSPSVPRPGPRWALSSGAAALRVETEAPGHLAPSAVGFVSLICRSLWASSPGRASLRSVTMIRSLPFGSGAPSEGSQTFQPSCYLHRLTKDPEKEKHWLFNITGKESCEQNSVV